MLPYLKLLYLGLFCMGIFGHGDGLFAEDELAAKSNPLPGDKPFPFETKLLGYIQRSGNTAVLISITGPKGRVETHVLYQGIEKTILLDDVPEDEPTENSKDASEAIFLQVGPIDTDNRSVLLGFPHSPFKSKTCRMAD